MAPTLSLAGLLAIHNFLHTKKHPLVQSSAELIHLCHGDLKLPSFVTESLLCAACAIVKARQYHMLTCPSQFQILVPLSSLKADHTVPGNCFSCDHYISPIPLVVLFLIPGIAPPILVMFMVLLGVDHASQWMFHSPKHSLNPPNTINRKLLLEHEAADFDISIKLFHTNH